MATDRIRQRHADEYFSSPGLLTAYFGFNTRNPPFDKPQVRRAFTMGYDRIQVERLLTRGQLFPATGGYVHPDVPGHVPNIALPYDPEEARRLLAQAGFPGGQGFPEFDFVSFSLPVDETVESIVTSNWQEKLGLKPHVLF